MKQLMHYLLALLFVLSSTFVFADDKPSIDEINRIFNYYDNGYNLGATLANYRICNDIHREGPNKNNCAEEVAGNSLETNQPAYLWMLFMVPNQTDNEKVLLQFNYKGVTRRVKTHPINGAFRYRTWSKVKFDRPGEWVVKVLQESDDDVTSLGEFIINVNDPAVAQVEQ